jgi:catechol-2,3-dioxygenase
LRIHHVALRTGDVGRLERFYAEVLGLPVMRRDAARGSVWLAASESVIMLECAQEGEPAVTAGSMELLAFSVASLGDWRQRLTAAGIAIEGETAHTLYFRDPDGRRVGVSDYSFER